MYYFCTIGSANGMCCTISRRASACATTGAGAPCARLHPGKLCLNGGPEICAILRQRLQSPAVPRVSTSGLGRYTSEGTPGGAVHAGRWCSWLSHLSHTQVVLSSNLGRLITQGPDIASVIIFFRCLLPLPERGACQLAQVHMSLHEFAYALIGADISRPARAGWASSSPPRNSRGL